MEVAHRSGWNRLSTLPFGFRFWKPIAIEPNRRSFRFRRFLRDNNSQTLSRVRYRLGFRPSRIYFRSALGGSCGFRAFRQRPATRRKSFSKSKSMSPWTLMVSFCFAFFFLAERLPSPRLRGFPPAAFHVDRNVDDDETRIDWPYPSRISAKPKVSRKNCSVYGRSSLLFPSPQQHADVALEGGTPHQKKNPRKPWEKKESLQVEF